MTGDSQRQSQIELYTVEANGSQENNAQNGPGNAPTIVEKTRPWWMSNICIVLTGSFLFLAIFSFIVGFVAWDKTKGPASQQSKPVTDPPIITCNAPDIQETNVKLGKSSSATYTTGEKIQFSCENGFATRNGTTAVCKEDGTWTTQPPSCVPICELALYNTQTVQIVNAATVYMLDDTVEFTCEQGYYQHIGDVKIRCQNDGKWDGDPLYCAKRCDTPNYDTDAAEVYLVKDSYEYGDSVYFKCAEGYAHYNGSVLITCKENGEWDKPAFYCVKMCNAPTLTSDTVPANPLKPEYRYGDIVNFTCAEGYALYNGSMWTRCGEGGLWDRPRLNCAKMCQLPEYTVGSHVAVGSYEPFYINGDYVYLSCEHGYSQFNGSSVVQCGPDGEWDRPYLVCSEDEILRAYR